jgi:predicted RNase H-like HicB family nuclease
MKPRTYPVVIQEGEDKKFVAYCPAIEGCFSQGDSIPDAVRNIREAIELCLEDMIQRGEALPQADQQTFLTEVAVDA